MYKGKPCSQQSSMKLVANLTLTLKRSSLHWSVDKMNLPKTIDPPFARPLSRQIKSVYRDSIKHNIVGNGTVA